MLHLVLYRLESFFGAFRFAICGTWPSSSPGLILNGDRFSTVSLIEATKINYFYNMIHDIRVDNFIIYVNSIHGHPNVFDDEH